MVTNYIVRSTSVDFKERFVLPQFRKRMNDLIDVMDELAFEPLLVVGKDGMWWNDDMAFILDRMSGGECCRRRTPLYDWALMVEKSSLKDNESLSIEYKGNVYTVSADCTDLSNDGMITNDCEPVVFSEGVRKTLISICQ